MRFHSPTLLASLMFAASATARFVMYYDEWHPSRPTSAEDRAGIDHVIIAFAPSNETATFKPKVSVETLRSEFPNAKIMIAVGGWGDTGNGFSDAAKSETGITKFATDAATMLTNTGADGVDIDWEYPGGNGADYKDNPNSDKAYEIAAFPKMLKAIRTAIGDKLLSIAVPGKTGDMLAYTTETGPTICEAVDYVNVMSYDLVNRRDLVTGHHTSVNGTKASIQAYLDIGCDAQKLNLGYAFYAKYFTTSGDCSSQPLGCAIVAAEDPTTGKDTMTSGAWTFEKAHMQPFDESAITPATDGKCGPDSMTKCPAGNCCSVDGWCGATPEHCGGACQHAFGEGCTGPDVYASWQKAAVAGMTDDTAGGEYFFDAESKLFWTWDTVELMQKKISDIVNPMHVGGVMAWSLGEDSDGWKHIKAISEWVKQPGGNNMTSTPSGTPGTPSGTPENVGGEQVSVVTVTKTVTATAYAAPSA